MKNAAKLPLVKRSISLLVEELDENDRVTIVVYAGAEGLALDTEAGDENATSRSVLGFGTGNINDAMLEAITNHGNGTYYYIDSFNEARKVLLEDLTSTLVTALYEIRPAGERDEEEREPVMSDLRYQKRQPVLVPSGDLATVALRYQKIGGSESRLIEKPVRPSEVAWGDASGDQRFAAAVGLFGMVLREMEGVDAGALATVRALAEGALGNDPHGRRREFLELVRAYSETVAPVR